MSSHNNMSLVLGHISELCYPTIDCHQRINCHNAILLDKGLYTCRLLSLYAIYAI